MRTSSSSNSSNNPIIYVMPQGEYIILLTQIKFVKKNNIIINKENHEKRPNTSRSSNLNPNHFN